MDPYDNGTAKYSTAQAIYDALCVLVQTEEMGILSEIGMDVSWENQTYYYTEKGAVLKDEFEKLSDCGNQMWILDVAIYQAAFNDDRQRNSAGLDTNDFLSEILSNSDFAKRVGFKKLFVEKILKGNARPYDKFIDDLYYEMHDLNRFNFHVMIGAFERVAKLNGLDFYGVSPYPNFIHALHDKLTGLKLSKEVRLVVESKAHLTAYDDFIFGLRVNQALHVQQERLHANKMAALQAAYNEKLKLLLMAADRAGLLPALSVELKQLEAVKNLIGGTAT